MNFRNIVISFVFLSAFVFGVTYGNYWFQFGARGGISSEFNNGTMASIETVFPQNYSNGSPAFWVGEDLANGAFLQMGYLIANQTGSYPSYCSEQFGCGKYQDIKAGQEEWFYEYFPENYNGGGFLGGIGSPGSAGANGTYNRYGFYYNQSSGYWDFLFNGKVVGNVSLGSPGSGVHSPVAFGEVANATANGTFINPVNIKNFSVYTDGEFTPAPQGYAYIGYGSGSLENVPVPYGVEEIGNRVNYFKIGSGLPRPLNGTSLWNQGYVLSINSEYGNLTNFGEYLGYSRIKLYAPRIVNISNGVSAVFTGWVGRGYGSYTGPANTTAIVMESNITETAEWQIKYYLNVSTDYGSAYGYGWYNANSTVPYGISSNMIYTGNGSREVFLAWSNGANTTKGYIIMNSPHSVNALWRGQYYVNVSSQYGNASGSGWVFAGRQDIISVTPENMSPENNSRYAFYSWSDGNRNASFNMVVEGPENLVAVYKKEYLHFFRARDSYGDYIHADYFEVGGVKVNDTGWFFSGDQYNITKAYYMGSWLPVNQNFTIGISNYTYVQLPVYNLEVFTKDIFGNPVNTSVNILFYNGSERSLNSGPNGEIYLKDIPYGEAHGQISGFLIPYSLDAGYGNPVYIDMITYEDMLAFGLIIVLVAAMYVAFSRKMHHKKDFATISVKQPGDAGTGEDLK